jgi:hypothetical protein
MLPSENALTAYIQSQLSEELSTARALLQLGCKTHSRLIESQTNGLSDVVKCTALGLYTKACKQYRSAIALCEIGLAEDADVIARSQFESLLALRFVLQPRVSLGRFRTNLPAIPTNYRAREFRARLYVAHQCLKPEKLAHDMDRTPRLNRLLKKSTKQVAAKDAVEWGKIIGPWYTILNRSPRTYSGLSVAKLSKALGLENWYVVVYGKQSSRVHASDALDYLDVQAASVYAKLEPDPSGVPLRLQVSSRFFGLSTDIVNNQFGLGFDSQITSLRDRIDQIAADSS